MKLKVGQESDRIVVVMHGVFGWCNTFSDDHKKSM